MTSARAPRSLDSLASALVLVASATLAPLSGLVASNAAAQDASGSPRAAHAVGLFADLPALLVADDRAFFTSAPTDVVTVCSYASGRCEPIRSSEPCTGQRCPSGGFVAQLEHGVASVGELPSDRDGLVRLQSEVASDPRIASIAGYLPQPAPPTPPPTFHLHEEDWRFEAAIGGGIALRPETSLALASMFAGLSWGIGVDWDDEEIMQVLFGNVLGAEARLRILPGVLGTSFDQVSVAVGIGPHARWAPHREPLRIGAGYFSFFPELGVITHPTLAPAFYFGWTYPVSIALDPHFALELRAWVYLVDDWVEGDDMAYLAGLDLDLLVF